MSYSFANTANSPQGTYYASVSYGASNSAPPAAWISQNIPTVIPNTHYSFSAYTRASSANPGCSISFFIADGNGATGAIGRVLATVPNSSLKNQWAQTTGEWDTPARIPRDGYSVNVKVSCPAGIGAKSYFFDDLVLIAS
ncbi:hypothetical protein B0H66DRAFT_605110 [Apodospora peruviana]|uniref:Uncharacterized protein n=1 Tax=Apodospora peruviana TaxID=516989 RepID=A0AAE0I1G4_9PEZI|nr:hypothetical protein B0H66DRAFT_605110 [Apodospora peruviana]